MCVTGGHLTPDLRSFASARRLLLLDWPDGWELGLLGLVQYLVRVRHAEPITAVQVWKYHSLF